MRVLLLALLAAVLAAQPQTIFTFTLGGRELDAVNAAAADAAGNIYVAGQTYSRDFPTAGPESTSCHLGPLGGCVDAFAAKISADGSRLIYSLFIGSSGSDEAVGLAVTPDGTAFVAGTADHAIFLVKLTPDGRQEFVRTYTVLPLVRTRAMAIDRWGNVYLTGDTLGPIPLFRPLQDRMGAPSCTAAGGSSAFSLDAFIMKFSPSGDLIYSTYFGGSGNDGGIAIGVDLEANIYVAGHTSSRDLPLVNAIQTANAGGEPTGPGQCEGGDGFLAKISADGQKLVYSTYFGTETREQITSLAVSPEGYLTAVRSGPTGRLLTLRPDGSLLWEQPSASSESIARDHAGRIYLAIPVGYVLASHSGENPQYPFLTSPFQNRLVLPLASGLILLAGHIEVPQSVWNGVIMLLRPSAEPCTAAFLVNAASYRAPYVAPDSIATLFGCGLEGITRVEAGGVPARILSSSSTQINLVLPPNLPAGRLLITLRRGEDPAAQADAQVEQAAPALFTADFTGTGPPAAVALRVAADGTRSSSLASSPIDLGGPADRTFLLLFGTGFRYAAPSSVVVRANGVDLRVVGFAAQSEYAGLDQINVELPRTLMGAGKVDLQLSVDGRLANPVTIEVR